jgi:hypothetical protein
MCRRGPSDRVPRARGCVSSIESGPRRGVSSLYRMFNVVLRVMLGDWELGLGERDVCVFM